MFYRICTMLRYDTLSGKLRLWNGFLILLVGFLTILPFAEMEYEHNKQEVHKQLIQTITLQKMFIEQWLDERASDIRNLARLESTRQMDKESIRKNFISFLEQQQDFYSVVYVNSKGITEIDTKMKPGIDISDRPYFQAAKQGKEFISGVFIGKDFGRPILIFSAPVFNERQQFNGLIFGAVNIVTIEKLMMGFRTGRTGETYLLDQEGLMLTDSRFANKLIEMGKVKDTARLHLRVDSQIYQEALVGEHSYDSYRNYLNEEVYGTYTWVNNHRWIIVGELGKIEVLAPFSNKLTAISICVFFVWLIGGLILLNIIQKLKHMLYKLQLGAQHIQQENYHYSLNPADFRDAPLEIRSLYEAFNQMTHTIQSKICLLAESEARYRQLVELSPDAIMVFLDGQIVLANNMAAAILGFDSPKQLIGKMVRDFVHPVFLSEGRKNIEKILNARQHQLETFQCKIVPADKRFIDVEVAASYITYSRKPAVIVVFRDITERKEEEMRLHEENQMLQQLSQLDGLIGIANRRLFDSKLVEEWEASVEQKSPLSLIMLDIDYFKEYNDTYGHQMGDQCLKRVAQILDQEVQKHGGMIARYGGEEFAIILPKTEKEKAFQIALSLRKAVEELNIPHISSRTNRYVTISLGVASIRPADATDSSELLQSADKALYQAKQKGRNRAVLYGA